MSTDVAVVGGGITGVTAALLLAQGGLRVVLLEAHRVGAGATGYSTGNLYQTVSHGLHATRSRWDGEVASQVAQSRRDAIAFVERQAALEQNEQGNLCGFRRCPLYFYAAGAEAEGTVYDEYQAAQQAGMAARLVGTLPEGLTPAAHGPVLVMEGQAQFHPLAYVQALARRAHGAGALIYERSPVVVCDASERSLRTPVAHVQAREIVLATHSPCGRHPVQAGLLPGREYGVAYRLATDSPCPPGIFWAQGAERLSLRGLEDEPGRYWLAVGVNHGTGQRDAVRAMQELEDRAERQLGLRDPAYRWSGQHFHSPDGLPYIGRDAAGTYIATGFGTDGLTYGTLAAQLIAEQLVEGRRSAWSELYRPDRLALRQSLRGMFEGVRNTAKAWLYDYLTHRHGPPLQHVQPHQGAIVEVDGERCAAYRDPQGDVHLVSPVCTHMKCIVRWNALETSWDCPCHGSRFAPDGRVLEGPAMRPLERKVVAIHRQE
ncbi:FAD dependent oxidoreductase [Caldimonas brevitalea]|uniref:FAD dependent oxidoreductase n=1 Tax=Caldimonas brevitalea TaxID=413882 RepID=A0A0G3BW10_9BURK|nr:FAD dependent oxidoreductase [Caldimonas brevitalea]